MPEEVLRVLQHGSTVQRALQVRGLRKRQPQPSAFVGLRALAVALLNHFYLILSAVLPDLFGLLRDDGLAEGGTVC